MGDKQNKGRLFALGSWIESKNDGIVLVKIGASIAVIYLENGKIRKEYTGT